jgi:site-specific recombinase XerD
MERLPTIYLEQIVHRKKHQILLKFDFNNLLIGLLKKTNEAHWSQTHRSWYVEDTKENLALILMTFKGITFINKKNYISKDKYPTKTVFKRDLTAAQKTLLNSFYLYLKGKRYSTSTLQTYTFFVADFVNFHTNKALELLTNRDVELFIETVFIERKYSISSQRQFISALKLFTVFYPHTQINDLQLTRPKRSRKLPNVLSQEDILRILQVTKNLKHRAILGLLYSSGLRIGEITSLRLFDIDVQRKQIKVSSGKGRKDRFVVIANTFLPLLQNYLLTYKPLSFFIEGPSQKRYSESSIRKFLAKSTALAGVTKNVTPHTLRHSFATHLLENGVGLRHIQELLGHSKPETTMIYTHVAKKDLLEIQSPLDTILLSLKINSKEEQKFLLSGINPV